MSKASIEYMNARRALLPASGGATQSRAVKYAPECELEPCERLELETESAWSDYRIRADAMWQQIFERFGYLPAETVDEIPF